MADLTARIEQFRKMAEADPGNELGHFSLGRAYLEAGMFPEAADALERVLKINPNLSKTYHLLGEALLKQKRKDEAIVRLTEGVKVAHARGDAMVKTELTRMLRENGGAVPEFASAATAVAQVAGEGEITCKRCGLTKPKLARQPFKGALGTDIFANTCADCWKEAIGQGTKVINELRLPLTDPKAQKVWDQHIKEFLNLP